MAAEPRMVTTPHNLLQSRILLPTSEGQQAQDLNLEGDVLDVLVDLQVATTTGPDLSHSNCDSNVHVKDSWDFFLENIK